MGHESITSPHRRAQNPVSPLSASLRRQFQPRDELDSWMALFRRHQFLLVMLAILTFLCTIYLYFAITLGAAQSCSGLSGTQKALCHLGQMKTSMPRKGKLKFFWQWTSLAGSELMSFISSPCLNSKQLFFGQWTSLAGSELMSFVLSIPLAWIQNSQLWNVAKMPLSNLFY